MKCSRIRMRAERAKFRYEACCVMRDRRIYSTDSFEQGWGREEGAAARSPGGVMQHFQETPLRSHHPEPEEGGSHPESVQPHYTRRACAPAREPRQTTGD